MAHARKQIRDALVKALKNQPTANDNVFTDRANALEAEEMPGIVIVTPAERSLIEADTKQHREAQVKVYGFDRGENIEARLDQLALEVEEAIFADVTLGIGVKTIDLDGMEIAVEDGTERVGSIEMTFTLLYRTERGAPGTIIA